MTFVNNQIRPFKPVLALPQTSGGTRLPSFRHPTNKPKTSLDHYPQDIAAASSSFVSKFDTEAYT
jgi:hypothetical protein